MPRYDYITGTWQPDPVPNWQTPTSPINRQEVIRVHGKEGASAYSLPPNSSVLLLDETQPIVWCKMTDGAGFPTLKGYYITEAEEKDKTPQQEETPIYVTTKEFDELKAKVDKLLEDLK